MMGAWPFFDALILTLSSSHLAKGGVLAALLCFTWLWQPSAAGRGDDGQQRRNRAIILCSLLSAAIGEVFARLLSNSLPFRLRPFLNPDLAFQAPESLMVLAPEMLAESSFPSDHAVLFFALVAGLWLISWRIGAVALLYTLVFIMFPRLYLGLHYLSDLAVGAAIGVGFTLVGTWLLGRTALVRIPIGWSFTAVPLFYPAFFLFMFQVATMLEDVRAFLHLLRTA
ncbi:phosphatase PAP2 family protein [Parasphingopyxis algicola]|nr:phosphatase PAP2 family protein [Parasphingopyxis algicola]